MIEPGSRIYLTAARVAVQGAIFNPGSFSYRKDFSIWNYENLAGGFDPEKSGGNATVFDAKGKERKPTDSIQPGDRVYVHVDKFIYNFQQGPSRLVVSRRDRDFGHYDIRALEISLPFLRARPQGGDDLVPPLPPRNT